MAPPHHEAVPCPGNARCDGEATAPAPESEDRLETEAVHPGRRAGVPGPAASADVRRVRVDIGRHHVGFHLVALDIGRRAGAVDRIQHVEQLDRLVTAAEVRDRHHRPERGVGVLAAVLAHPRHVALDVAGVERRLVERWREQLDHARVSPHQLHADGIHGALCPSQRRGAGEHGPALRDRIDPAFLGLGGAQRRAVVEVGAAIPVTIPGLLEHRGHALALTAPAGGALGVAARLHDPGEVTQDLREEPSQPHALAAALMPNAVHAVIPVAGADERQSMRADGQAALDGADTVFVEGPALARHRGLTVDLSLAGREGGRFQEGHGHVEHGLITGALQVVGHSVREPQQVVGAAAAHAAAGMLVPPVLHVPFYELAGGAAQQVLAEEVRPREPERHHILELISEAVRAARLKEAGAPPQP